MHEHWKKHTLVDKSFCQRMQVKCKCRHRVHVLNPPVRPSVHTSMHHKLNLFAIQLAQNDPGLTQVRVPNPKPIDRVGRKLIPVSCL